jgi:hypothetical protein
MTLQFSDIPSTGEPPLVLNRDSARNAERFSPDANYGDNIPARGYGLDATTQEQRAKRELRQRRDQGLEAIPGFPARSRLADGEESNDDTFQDEDGMLLRSKTARGDTVFLEAQPADPGLLTLAARRALGLVPLPGFGA